MAKKQKIHKQHLKNFMGIPDAEVIANGKSVYVTGPNNAGKSTFSEAALVAIGAKKPPLQAIMLGKEKAKITVELGGQNTELIIERTFTESNPKGKLTVKGPDGAVYPSPQKVLDEALGTVFFDMGTFINAKNENEAIKYLNQFLNIDTDAIDAEYKTAFEARTDTNREIKKLEAMVEGSDAEDPGEVPDATELRLKAQSQQATKDSVATLEGRIANGRQQITSKWTEINSKQAQIDALLKEVQDAKNWVATAEEAIVTLEAQATTEAMNLDQRDYLTELTQISNLATRKSEWNQHVKNKADLKSYQETSEKQTEQLEKIKEKKAEMYKQANLPGVTIDEEGLRYNGLPLRKDQINTAGLAELAIDIIIAQNSPFRFVRFDATVMDKQTKERVFKKLHDNDMQYFVEEVDKEAEAGELHIEVIEEE